MRILIAEDQEMSRMILGTHLRNWGHTVVETPNGRDALEFISDNPHAVDMLITDWGMPEMNGLELARRVRALSDFNPYVYIILLTARNALDDMIEGFTAGGVDDYIVKPFEVSELQMRIQVGNRLVLAERAQRLHNSQLEQIVRQQTEAIRETQHEIIWRLFSALESRDEETASHVRRIGIISAYLAELLGWTPRQVDAIRAAAPLHDIGKIGIPDSVLLKPGILNEEEFAIITQHTNIGARILSGSRNPVIQMAEIIARHHHENWDGSGYPEKLGAEGIPIEARIVAVVDVYDALLSDRVYRHGLEEEVVLRMIRQESGRKFDPILCQLFLDHIDAIKQLCRQSGAGETVADFDPTLLEHLPVHSMRGLVE